ncbi:sag-related sequence srs25 [Cystoisospora suis]|uniref:Sag-related sequence srs25 n=1 Tax=Cystoisospora suis TaxID=483139 RepID=A0A2C6L346_9APIC|nr:sag-related sequence srs25 [Cystoisospora suis]
MAASRGVGLKLFATCFLGFLLVKFSDAQLGERTDRNKLVFGDCDKAYHRVVQTVRPGEKFEIFCQGAKTVAPSDPNVKCCKGPDGSCNDTNSTDYRTIFPDAPSDFQFWTGGDTLTAAGFLYIPDKVQGPNPVISFGWVGLPQYAYEGKPPVSNITLIVQANSATGILKNALLLMVGLPVVATFPALTSF